MLDFCVIYVEELKLFNNINSFGESSKNFVLNIRVGEVNIFVSSWVVGVF